MWSRNFDSGTRSAIFGTPKMVKTGRFSNFGQRCKKWQAWQAVLVLFFSPAVLIFGLCMRKNVKLAHPAQIIACTIKHSYANF